MRSFWIYRKLKVHNDEFLTLTATKRPPWQVVFFDTKLWVLGSPGAALQVNEPLNEGLLRYELYPIKARISMVIGPR
jgi:hypothetical protein